MNYTLFLTGLSGAGKSTIAEIIKKKYQDTVLLDGDVVRTGLCSDLNFSNEDRTENIRRLSELCKLFNNNGKNVIAAFIAPFEVDRQQAKNIIPNCHIIHIDASLEQCEARDVKGLYAQARKGIIPQFTGITSPYEIPIKPELKISTALQTITQSVNLLVEYIDTIDYKENP